LEAVKMDLEEGEEGEVVEDPPEVPVTVRELKQSELRSGISESSARN
jgi:hypothetical protein